MIGPSAARTAAPDERSVATLPIEGVRSQVYSDKRAMASLEVDRDIDLSATDGMARLSAAVAAVLARYEEVETVPIGLCKNGVAVAASISTPRDGTLDSLAAQAALVLDSITWDPIEFQRQLSMAGLNGLAGRNPLFAVLVVVDGHAAPALHQDVTLHFDGERTLIADYNVRLFRDGTVARFLTHVNQILLALQDVSPPPLFEARMLDAGEEAELVALGDGGAAAFNGTVQELLASALARSSEKPVAEFGTQSWSLKELVERADAIGAALGARLHSKGARVGVALRPGGDQIAALIAIIRLSAVIVPLDTTLPAMRQSAIRSVAELTAIITEDFLLHHFAGTDPIILERITPFGKGTVSSQSPEPATSDDPLYLMFTSGTTGQPKGVLVPHRTLANLIVCEDRRRSAAGRRTLGRTSIAFDVALQEIFATILFGGILVIASDEERGDVSALASLLSTRRIARAYLPPVALHQMAEAAEARPASLEHLEEVIVAGEQLRISQAVRRFFRATNARLINQYGPTETHVATEAILDPTPLRWPDLPAIGRPLPGVRTYVVTATGQLAPLLVPGELMVGGSAPALGYTGQPDLTQARFIRDPFASSPDAMAYRTGDCVRLLSGGRLEFLGRRDDQVKVRGYRVELSDLEVNAEQLPGVSLAVAKHWVTATWTGLALYLVLRDYSRASLRELRSALRERVPEYMLPPLSAMMLLDDVPLTTSGKVDRSRLPHPGTSDGLAAETLTIADHVAGIWSRRLGLGRVPPDDDFLDLGGHSLLAIQIVSEVNDAFNIGVPLSILLRGSSLRTFTEAVEELLGARAGGAASGYSSAGLRFPQSPSTAASESLSVASSMHLPGGTYAVVSRAEARHLWTEIFVQHAYRHPAFRYQPGATVIDVGANIGIFSRYALKEARACRLLAIEPAIELFDCLRQNLAGMTARIDLLQLGCGAHDEEASSFSYFPQVPSMSSFAPALERDKALLADLLASNLDSLSGGEIGDVVQGLSLNAAFEAAPRTARRRRLSTIIRELDLEAIDLLKIDVQQGEQEVLRGIDPEHWGLISQVVVELQDHAGHVDQTLLILRSAGLSVDVGSIPLHQGTNIRFVYGWRD